MAAILFFIIVGLFSFLVFVIFLLRSPLGLAVLFFLSLLYLLSPSRPLAIPEPHTELSTKISPSGQFIPEISQSGTADFPEFDLVLRRAPPDNIPMIVTELAVYQSPVIFEWKDNSHLEINGIAGAHELGLPTRAGDIDISYSQFNDWGAVYQYRKKIIEETLEKSPISPDKVTASFSEAFETDSLAPLTRSPPLNTCILSIEAEGGMAFDKTGIVIRGGHEGKIKQVEFWLGARVDHAYQPSIFDAFIIGADATIVRGEGENQLRAISVVGPGDGPPRILPFPRRQPIPAVYRTGLDGQFYIYELHTDNIHEQLDRFRGCIGYN